MKSTTNRDNNVIANLLHATQSDNLLLFVFFCIKVLLCTVTMAHTDLARTLLDRSCIGKRRNMSFRTAGATNEIASCDDSLRYPTKELLPCTCAPFTPYPVGPWSPVCVSNIACEYANTLLNYIQNIK